ncbi:hypothetical protein ZIOFF_009465 [Zingiber officinale]|uniref:Late embryogenesis abundant protein LEA-2 subgroup domain-containing protein n=1 Tax=Zingiber officinale TaxID=94328 RepID=A0A8J5HHE0_ZINOF|nr:hypothetical protein ZIOFF_009465 [Zingiber officinale]
MAEAKPTLKPVIHKPPGYRDPEAPPPPVPKAPPRRRPLPPSFRQPGKPLPRRHRSRRSCCCRLCCWASVVVLALAALIAVAAGLAYLWFQPRLPSFRLESLNATRLRVSSRPDGTFLDVSTSVGILVSNPNGKIVLEYGDWEARVRVADDDGDVDVGAAEVAGFEQGRRNRTVVRFKTAAKAMAVDEVAGGRIQAGFRRKEMKLGVNLRSRVGLRVGGSSTGKLPIRVGCSPVSLKQGVSHGTLPLCRLYLFRWCVLFTKIGLGVMSKQPVTLALIHIIVSKSFFTLTRDAF